MHFFHWVSSYWRWYFIYCFEISCRKINSL